MVFSRLDLPWSGCRTELYSYGFFDIHPSVEECQQFYKTVYEELSDLDGYVSLDFHCVQAAVVEDYL